MPNYDVSGNSPAEAEIIIQYPARKQMSPKVGVVVNFLLDRLRGRDPLDIAAAVERTVTRRN
jgi:hypothetical protein